MNTAPTVLFSDKTDDLDTMFLSKNLPKNKKAGLLNRLMTPLVTGGVTAGGLDYLQNKDNYGNITPTRVGLGVVNLLTGALGGNLLAKGEVTKGLGTVLLAPTKDVTLAAIPALHQLQKSQEEIAKTQEHIRKPFIDRLSTTEKGILGGAGLVGATALIPMIINMSRAAKRVGEGKSIRVSTSLRKRPNQDTDLNIGIKREEDPIKEDTEIEEQEPLKTTENEKPKGFFHKIFNS